MSNKKRLLSRLMIFLITVALLAGCLMSAGGAAAATKPDPFGKYTPAIEVTGVRVIPNVATQKYAPGDSADKNPWTREYEEKLGIKLKYKWMVDQSQWEQKSNLMIASGDIPDVFMASSIQFAQLRKAGLLADMTKAYEDYASSYTKSIVLESGPDQLNSCKFDGKLMAVPFTGLPREGVPILYVRTDWLKKLNLSEPQNMNDLIKIAYAFTKNDPDGNKKNDTYGIVMDNVVFSGDMLWTGLAYGYHAYPNSWIKDKSGKLAYGSIQQEMRPLLSKMQELYKAGVIDKEFGNKDVVKAYETLTSGKTGIYYGGFWGPLYPIQSLYNNDSKVQWKAFPMPSIDKNPAKSSVGLGIQGYWVVNKKMKNPEAIVKMMNVWTQTFYGNTSDTIYNKLVNGKDGSEIWQNAFIQCYRGYKNLAGYYNVTGVLTGSKFTSQLTPEERQTFNNIKKFQDGDKTMWCWGQIYGIGGSMGVVDIYKKNNLYVNDEFYGTPTKTMVTKQATLSKLEKETFTKIIKGAKISEFDKFINNWKKLGGDAITKEVNEWYKNK